MNKSDKINDPSSPDPDDKSGMFLLDEASSLVTPIAPELGEQKRIAGDASRPISERIEAYEDIFDSEVGDTSLSRARNIEREVGFRQIFLKFEGGNPTGTQKDRIAFSQILDALRRGFDAVTLATCGNYGVAMAFAASLAALRCEVFIPDTYHTKRENEMRDLGAAIHRISGDYEKAVVISREFAQKNEVYDANPGGANTILQLRAYGEIANEIYDEIRDAPGYLAIPVSNGTTLAGIYKGFLSLYRRGKTSRIPKLIAGSSFRKNPIIHAFLKNNPTCSDLAPEKIKETAVNEPLINWQSIDGDLALNAVRETGGIAGHASDKAMMFYAKFIREREGLSVLPASTVGLITLLEWQKKAALGNDRYVVILTGRKT
jgi:threonine synthase